MKRHFCIFLTIIIFLVIGCTADDDAISSEQHTIDSIDSTPNGGSIAGNNLLLNNGVEVWNTLDCVFPKYWLPPEGDCYRVTRNQDVVFDGQFSAKMKAINTGTTARIHQLVEITPGCKIRIRFNYYIEQWNTNGARTYCYFRTGPAENTSMSIADLRSIYSDAEYYIFRGGGYGKAYLPHTLNTWLVFDETITVPQNANYFEFGINSYHGTTIYVDNCYVIEY